MKNYLRYLIVFLLCIVFVNLIYAETNYSNGYDNSTNYTTTNETLIEISNITIINFFPKESKIGDVQLNIQIQNNKKEKISNIIPFISGRGFSTYNVAAIEELGVGEKDYAFVNGNFRESGNITLTIKINNEIFYQNMTLTDTQTQNIENSNKELLENLSIKSEELKANYSALESEINNKKDEGYDVSKINLDELKKMLRAVQADLLSENAAQAKVDVNLAIEEYFYQKNQLDKAKPIGTISKVKDYAILFSSIGGAIILLFTLSELLKKKSVNIVTSVNFFKKKEKTPKNKK